ncbi:hypothetical protein [Mesorhizobium sp. 43Arga]
MTSTLSGQRLSAKAPGVTMPWPRATSDILRSTLSASTLTWNGSLAASKLSAGLNDGQPAQGKTFTFPTLTSADPWLL